MAGKLGRGYAAIGVEGVSKARNAGALIRTAHAFGAAFAFFVNAQLSQRELVQADTSKALRSVPLYSFADAHSLALPEGCSLVGVEITDDAHDLPSFRHPRMAAYLLGSERLGLSPAMLGLCDHVIRIPTRFSLNLAVAGALVLYDRMQSQGRFAPRPATPGGPAEPLPEPVFGKPLWMRKQAGRKG